VSYDSVRGAWGQVTTTRLPVLCSLQLRYTSWAAIFVTKNRA